MPSQNAGEAGNQSQQNQGSSAKWSDPLIVLQLFLFIAVAVQAAIYGWQLWVMRRTLGQIKRQADAMDSQVSATEGQLTAMRETHKQIQSDSVKQQDFMMIQGRGLLSQTEIMLKSLETVQRQLGAMEREEVIMREQARIMGDSLMVSSGSQVDVDSIEMIGREQHTQSVIIKIGNIGHVPADEIKVWVAVFFQVSDRCEQSLGIARPKHHRGYFWDFKSSKLFPGKLRIKLFVPIHKDFNGREMVLVGGGEARFVVQIKISNKDGFGFQESEFAFRYVPRAETKEAGWLIYTVRPYDDLLRNLYEGEDEQPRYYEKEQTSPN